MIGVPAYRFGKAPRCVSQLDTHCSRLGAVVDRRELPHAASSTAGDDGTLARRITD
jgi:hypothetical protein